MESLGHSRILQPGGGTAYEFPGFVMTIVFLATADDTDGAYSVFESIHEPGSGAPLHIHHRQDETAYIVEGEFLVRAGTNRYSDLVRARSSTFRVAWRMPSSAWARRRARSSSG